MSNSFLNKFQKASLREGKFSNPDMKFFSFPQNGVTIALQPEFAGSKMSTMAISTMSSDEEKFRKNVGEYHAYVAMLDGRATKVQVPVYNYDVFANSMASILRFHRI